MNDQHLNSKDMQNSSGLKNKTNYTKSLNKQYSTLKLWKMKVEMISNMENQERKLRNEKITEMKNLQDSINQIRIQNCDFVHNLLESSWLLNLDNLKNLTQSKENDKRQYNLYVCDQLNDELKKANFILDGLRIKINQQEKLIELSNKIKNVQQSIVIWDSATVKIGKEKSK